MKFKPLGARALVKEVEREQTTESGIVLPDTAKEKPQSAEAVAVGAHEDVKVSVGKTTTGECNVLDVRDLYRDGLLKPGTGFSSSWSRAGREIGSIGGFVFRNQVILSYNHLSRQGGDWEAVKEAVFLEWTPCNFGGERPWFVCPGVINGVACGRRVAILYGPGKYFLCRHCYDLRYESQRDGKKDRALRRAQKIRQQLGGSANMMEPFPEKPKGMHLDTCMRLYWECHEAEMEHLVGVGEWLDKLQKQIA